MSTPAITSDHQHPAGLPPAPASEPLATPSEPPEPAGFEAHVSVAEAAAMLAIPERTLRDWILTGRVAAFHLPLPHPRGKRLRRSQVEALQRELAAAGTPPATTGETPAGSSDPPERVQVLAARLDAAEARAREKEEENAFLKARIEKMEEADQQWRVLMSQSNQLQARLTQELEAVRAALPAPQKARWWAPWKRA